MDSSTSSNPILGLLGGQIVEHVSSFDGTGQYTQGGTSTCGLAALNAVRIILGLEKSGVNAGARLLERIISKEVMDVCFYSSLDGGFGTHCQIRIL